MAAIAFRSAAPKSGFSLATLAGAIVAWNDRRVTRNSLNKLSAHQLEDIGLTYGQINAVANGSLIR